MVLRRCAITRAVRPLSRRSRASRIWTSVLVSTLEVASSRIRKRGLCESAREVDELALADAERGAALVNRSGDAFRKRADEIAEARFFGGLLDGLEVDARGAETDVGLDGAAEEEWILQDDAEQAA